jgi:hypothetical protein
MPRIFTQLIALCALAVSALTVSPAAAHYSQPCWVVPEGSAKYYSDWHRFYSEAHSLFFAVTCNYVTGMELNARAGVKAFAHDRIYVVILWPRSEPSYIRINQALSFCGEVAEPDCAESMRGLLTGRDYWYDRYGRARPRNWAICQPGFIDSNCYKALGGWRE